MLMPSAMASSIAGRPGPVAGILTNTFGRSEAPTARAPDARVPPLSSDRPGSTSIEAKPSAPSPRRRPAAARRPRRRRRRPRSPRRCSWRRRRPRSRAGSSSSYWPVATALAKIVGLLVRPRMPSSPSCSRSRPISISSRSMKSIHGLWSNSACSRCSAFMSSGCLLAPAGSRPPARAARSSSRAAVDDVLRVDARRGQLLGRACRAGHDRGPPACGRRPGCVARRSVEHRVAEAALRPVVLDGDDRPVSRAAGAERVHVDRLD